MLHKVPVLNHSVLRRSKRTWARASPVAVRVGSLNLAPAIGCVICVSIIDPQQRSPRVV